MNEHILSNGLVFSVLGDTKRPTKSEIKKAECIVRVYNGLVGKVNAVAYQNVLDLQEGRIIKTCEDNNEPWNIAFARETYYRKLYLPEVVDEMEKAFHEKLSKVKPILVTGIAISRIEKPAYRFYYIDGVSLPDRKPERSLICNFSDLSVELWENLVKAAEDKNINIEEFMRKIESSEYFFIRKFIKNTKIIE